MISYITRENLDIKKYDTCIKQALQSRAYAMSWYLDSVAQNWDVLVLNDYEAVMPLPWKQKYFLKYISQPYFCQQLGVFSKEPLSSKVIKSFIKHIPKKFVKIVYQFKGNNTIPLDMLIKNNYILNLNDSYKNLRANYRKDRKYRLNQAKKKDYEFCTPDSKALEALSKAYYPYLKISKLMYNNLHALVATSINLKKGFIIGVKNSETLLGASFFIKEGGRIYYLFSVVSNEGKKNNVASLIIDNVIQAHSNKALYLDLEGSMVNGIANFYKSFGAELEHYYFLNYNKLSFLKTIFTK